MLADASVLRSFAVLEWLDDVAEAVGGTLFAAQGVLALHGDEPCEMQSIREALQREAMDSGLGTGRSSKAVAAVAGLDRLLSMGEPTIKVLTPEASELDTVVQLTSSRDEHRTWRKSLGVRARRLDAGEAVSIAIAHARHFDFASDDEQAIIAFDSITHRSTLRTVDLIKLLVQQDRLDEDDARQGYRLLQEDDLHLLGGPDW